ncbi:hypothetical protein GRX01_00620 [Halobaculum sp. WSA2]|uniref:Metal-binding protein n=1 Tax=Halobaculum saliterrae TaxID=2073113 RepID=A0A6B0SQP1_9EURY|nr:hypothetical protein [Halobaculum saliterrae]
MRKIELVHLHELLLLVRDEYERQRGHAIDCEEYDQLETHPHAIAQVKEKHNEAIRTLAYDLTTDSTAQSSTDTDTSAGGPASPRGVERSEGRSHRRQ